jgi:UDP-N-acetylmuramoylalanine--D-glutamate ligase
MYEFKVDIAILLNITPDHLDRYDYKFENYVKSKFRILQNQDEQCHFIYCKDDEAIQDYLSHNEVKAIQHPFSIITTTENGAYIENEKLIINLNNTFEMTIQSLALQGKHNLYNSMASGMTGRVLELKKDIIRESLTDFQNVEHRLEFVAKIHGIDFINDSKATNINSTWYALESFDTPIIWVVGGVDKGNDYEMLKEMVSEKVKAIVCLGKDNSKIHEAFDGIIETIVDAGSAYEAVKLAYGLGKSGDTVLLSPACASFDLFENYEDRGQQFKSAVKGL